MNIETFYDEYPNLSDERKREGLKKIFDFILNDLEYNEEHIMDLLDMHINLEADDYFGTEGLDV